MRLSPAQRINNLLHSETNEKRTHLSLACAEAFQGLVSPELYTFLSDDDDDSAIQSDLPGVPHSVPTVQGTQGTIPRALDISLRSAPANTKIEGLMPSNYKMPARTEFHCEPCEFHKCTGMLHVRSGEGGWRTYSCIHPEAFEPEPHFEDLEKQRLAQKIKAIQSRYSRPIGKTEKQPVWCPLNRARKTSVKPTVENR